MPAAPRTLVTPPGRFRNPSNRFALDYRSEASSFPAPPVGIIDAHTHVNGARAAVLMREAMDLYGIERVWSMTALDEVEAVRKVLGERLELIAIPDWASKDRRHANGPGFLENIRRFHDLGARIVKFWAAPRAIDYGHEAGDPDLLRLDSPDRLRAMDLADSLGMTFMTHVADPDTWFETRPATARSVPTTSRSSRCSIASATAAGSPPTSAAGPRTSRSSTRCCGGTRTSTSTRARPSGWCARSRVIRARR
jgi:hypothetical protein